MGKKVIVDEEVFRGIDAVRNSGKVNMFDYHGVLKELVKLEYHIAVLWVLENKEEYAKAIRQGLTYEK